jgi:crossover junction endodeoxyribonuclease RuvC|tara:strand:+ start:1165 stop:1617 length:453 start_codon:yes stop_codon:yes gene_type:complete
MIITCGIDCGYRTGGVALIGDDWAEVHDLPVYSEGGVDVTALTDILISVDRIDHIWIERQQAMPKQGVSSTFKLGYAYGQIVTTVALSKVPYSLVTPVSWKRSMNLPKDKDAARRMAQQWFPALASNLKRKKDEHRAEALLIATYGRGKV